jgi:hypothetical protein
MVNTTASLVGNATGRTPPPPAFHNCRFPGNAITLATQDASGYCTLGQINGYTKNGTLQDRYTAWWVEEPTRCLTHKTVSLSSINGIDD